MTFSAEVQPAKRRGRSRNVSKSEVSAAWDQLRAAAGHGDVKACALLIALTEGRPLQLESQAA
jgi:hypothetical protein